MPDEKRILTRLKDHDQSEDLIQDVIVTLWEKRDQLNPDLKFENYLLTICYNSVRKFFRRKNIEHRVKDYLLKNLYRVAAILLLPIMVYLGWESVDQKMWKNSQAYMDNYTQAFTLEEGSLELINRNGGKDTILKMKPGQHAVYIPTVDQLDIT
jgi:RNA polymerase sigma factor (sigma-70 family)